jgi:hypothetical protein
MSFNLVRVDWINYLTLQCKILSCYIIAPPPPPLRLDLGLHMHCISISQKEFAGN